MLSLVNKIDFVSLVNNVELSYQIQNQIIMLSLVNTVELSQQNQTCKHNNIEPS